LEFRWIKSSDPTADLSPPPTHSDKEEAPVVKKFGFFALEGMADELQYPSQQEENRGVNPQPVEEDTGKDEHERK
jgi:hypothetical protein